MIILLLAALTGSHAAGADQALKLCRPVLARKAEGEIADIVPAATRASRRGTTITGQLTAFIGMGPPGPGAASTHHLIRAQFDFRCTVRRGRVVSSTLHPVQ